MRHLLLAGLASVLALSATACTGETTTAQGVLTENDLPGVASSADFGRRNGTSSTGCGALDVESTFAATQPPTVGTSFRLANNDLVISTRLGVNLTRGLREPLVQVDAAIAACVEQSSGESFERLEGLPGDAIGFRAVIDTSNGPRTTERAYAVASDQAVAVVTVQHDGAGKPSITVTELLATAVKRAAATPDAE